MGYPHHTLKNSIICKKYVYISTHCILSNIHISARTCHIHHKRGVTEVCHLGHFWLSCGRCAMSGSPIGLLVGPSSRQTDQATPRKTLPSCMFLGVSWLLYHAWNTYRMSSRAILMKLDYVTCGTMHHMRLSHARSTDMCD